MEDWMYQDGTGGEDELRAAAVRESDGMIVAAGYTAGEWGGIAGDQNWAAVGLDANGELLWRWQMGDQESSSTLTEYSDVIGKEINGAVLGEDGSSILVGATQSTDDESGNLAAIKLDETGGVLWIWQDGSEEGDDAAHAVAMAEDGSVVLGGLVKGYWAADFGEGESDLAACKLHANGTLAWKWQDGTDGEDRFSAAAMLEDGSVVLAGQTNGTWAGDLSASSLSSDFFAVKLSSQGEEIWRWQGGTDGDDDIEAAALSEDGAVVLAGWTTGDWNGTNEGGKDFAAVKLDADSNELWTWQNGTASEDILWAAAMLDYDQAVFSGYTEGSWEGTIDGDRDAAVVKISSEGSQLWGSQVTGIATCGLAKYGSIEDVRASLTQACVIGSSGSDVFEGMAAGPNGSMVLAGSTDGFFDGTENTGDFDLLVALLPGDTVATPSPTVSPTTPMPAPVLSTSSPGLPSPAPTPSTFPDRRTTPAPVTISPSVPGTSAPFTTAPANATTSFPVNPPPAEAEGSTSDNTPVIAGTISGAAIATALAVAAVCLVKRKRAARKARKTEARTSPVQPDGDVERGAAAGGQSPPDRGPVPLGPRGRGQTPLQSEPVVQGAPTTTAAMMTDLGPPAETVGPNAVPAVPGAGQQPAALGSKVLASATDAPMADNEIKSHSVLDSVEGDAAAGAAALATGSGLAATASTADASTAERADPLSVNPEDDAQTSGIDVPSKNGAGAPSASIGVAQAVLVAARQLAHNCQVPGISEAASMVSILVTLVADNRDSAGRSDREVKCCRSIVAMLQRATEVLGKKDDRAGGEVEQVLLEDVKDAVGDLLDVIKTYKSKNKIAQVLMSSLFRQRQDEAEAVIDRAISRLHLGLQVRVGHKLSEVEDNLHEVGQDMREGLEHQRRQSREEGSVAGSVSESLAEARQMRRKRNLNQIEIPENHLKLTDELLGRGGFGAVYMADYNGRNAAAKVVLVEHELGGLGGAGANDDEIFKGLKPSANAALHKRVESQRKAFLRELEAMVRLRSPHTVNIYGAVTSCSDRLVLVMELLAGGDLRTFLKNSEGLLPEPVVRRIAGDVCAGIAFLHGKATVHGDLKSANVLLDGSGRAKIADFGTSRWAQHTNSTGLATYTTKAAQNTQMTFAWAAPEVLDSKGTSFASDVYSLGVVVWEILTTTVPWADEALGRDIYLRVVIKGDRLEIPAGTPEDIAAIMRDCWIEAAGARPAASEIAARIRPLGRDQE